MEEWQKNSAEILEAVAKAMEQFLVEFNEGIENLAVVSEEVVHRWHSTISEDIERLVDDMLAPFEEIFPTLEESGFDDEWVTPDEEDPLFAEHPACVGCRHFHGQFYGGNLLVCGMHPHGWDGETCPDWESGGRIDDDRNPPFIF